MRGWQARLSMRALDLAAGARGSVLDNILTRAWYHLRRTDHVEL